MLQRWKLHGAHFQSQVPDILFIGIALGLSIFAIPLAGILVLVNTLRNIDPDIEID